MKKLVIALLVSVALGVTAAAAAAHQSGCHRFHSCPSDSGSYECGDLGYDSQCPVARDDPAVTESGIASDPAKDNIITALVVLFAVAFFGFFFWVGN